LESDKNQQEETGNQTQEGAKQMTKHANVVSCRRRGRCDKVLLGFCVSPGSII